MPSSNSSRDALLGQLADDFVARHRQGDRPALSEYTQRHPDLADDIRALFPALVQIERLKPAQGDLTSAFEAAATSADGARLQRLGEYRILREVGRGGMGVVYEAEQESLGRHVALKVLPSSALLNPTYRERFKREAKAAARLHHTNIVPVFGVGEHDGVPYYAMQFIRGEGLDKVLADVRKLRSGAPNPVALPPDGSIAHSLLTGQFAAPAPDPAEGPQTNQPTASGLTGSGPEAEYCRGVARIGAQVAEALSYAHKQGILHRDVKPSNLLLDAQGTVWVADFGLAKAEGSDELTGTGDVVGTLRFMAPERFDGRSLLQSDLYSLGATLYELLTLRPAFADANKARLIDKVLHHPPVPPRKLDANIPRDLETIVLKCLAKAPEERYASAEALAEDLHRFLADRPIKARRASNTEKVWRWCRRNPVVASLLMTVAALLVVGSVVSTFAVVQFGQSRQRAQDAEREAQLRRRAESAEREVRLKLFEAYLAEARANRLTRRMGQRFETLARVAAAARLARELDVPEERYADLRQVAVTALALPDLAPGYLGQVPDGVHVCDLSDDAARVLLWEPEASSHVIRSVATGQELCRLPTTGPRLKAHFGPGARHVVRLGRAKGSPIEVWGVEGPEPRRIRGDRFAVSSADFRPDASALALAGVDGTVAIWDLRKGTEIKRWPPERGDREPWVALHPTESLVATCSYFTPELRLRDYRTGQTIRVMRPPWRLGSTSLVWHPDGTRLFVAAGDSTEVQEYQFARATGQLRPARLLRTGPAPGGNVLAINPAGDRLVSRGWSGAPSLLDLETSQVLFQAPTLRVLDRFRFAADGRSVLGTIGSPRGRTSYGVIAVADAREVRAIPLSKAGSGWKRPVVHPGGRLAVVAQGDQFTFVDLATLRELGVVKRGSSQYVSLAFDGEGRLYTNSFEGCFRWPVRLEGERLTVGPPERLPFQPGREAIAVSADGRTVAQAQYLGYGMTQWAGGWLLSPQRPHDPFYLSAGASVMHADVSRDGRLVCFSINALIGNSASRLKVYDARTGQPRWEDPTGEMGDSGRFTPDGRWLVGPSRARRVGDWETSVRLGSSPTGGSLHDVSPDSRLALLGTTEGYARLVEIATGRELVRIETPDSSNSPLAFTPDGLKLLEPSSEGLRVWDLRRLRRELVQLGLDWNAPPYPPEPKAPAMQVLQLTILGGDLLSDTAKLAEYDRAQMQARLAKDPFDADGNLYLARQLLNQNRPGEALRHLERALLNQPRSYPVRMNRALCLVRLGGLVPALADYTAAAAARPEDYRPRYQRAQLYRRLGRHAAAADDLTDVLRRFPEDGELYEQRAECYAALGDKAKEKADRVAAEKRQPRSASELNNRAWRLLTGPVSERDPERALVLIGKALEIEPNQAMYQNTLGVALYRNARWTEAIVALEKSLAAGKGQHDAFDLHFLAMCHARRGDKVKAKDCFDRAVKWVARQKGLSAPEIKELAAFRKEAEEALRQVEKQ